MLCLVLLAAVFGFATSAPAEDLPVLGIVGGERANQKFFNFQVSLELYSRHFCGGTLVTTNIVVTAAHCTEVVDIKYFRIRVGSEGRNTGGHVYAVESFVNHPQYNNKTYISDVSVIKLAENVKLSKTVGTLKLADTEPKGNTPALVSGWGHTKEDGQMSNYLLFAQVTIFDRQYCRQRVWFTDEMICAGHEDGGVDSCQADSGGPLMANHELVGIVSWGIGCGRRNKPGVYSNVAHLKSWIDEKIEELNADSYKPLLSQRIVFPKQNRKIYNVRRFL